MFSLATPSMSERPLPPHPMQAMWSLSDGARNPRPSTCRGTIVNAAPAATSPTNRLLEMRFRAIRFLLTPSTLRFSPYVVDLTLFSLRLCSCRPEHHRKEHQHQRRECRRQDPETAPLIQCETGCGTEEAVVDSARDLRADEHPEAVCHQHQESLGLAPDRRGGSFVDVDLAGYEEEVVAHPVQQNADDDEADDRVGSGKGE